MQDPIGWLLFILVVLLVFRSSRTVTSDTLKQKVTSTLSVPSCRPVYVNGILYHGTPHTDYAQDILLNNKFQIKKHVPHGIYVTDKFGHALKYASTNGHVVMLRNTTPPRFIIDFEDVKKDSRYNHWVKRYGDSGDSVSRFIFEVLGKSLVRLRDNVFVAVIPFFQSEEFYRVEGLTPLTILDKKGNIIKEIA